MGALGELVRPPAPGPVDRPSVRRRPALPAWLRQAGILLLGACLLCLPAFYNGAPLIFPDLLDYVGDGMKILRRALPVWVGHFFANSTSWVMADLWPAGSHIPSYGLAIWPLHLEVTLWPVVIVQGLIVCDLLGVVARTLGLNLSAKGFLALVAGLAVLTSLPWYVSYVMPDIFGAVLVLSLFLLAFRAELLSRLRRLYIVVLATASLLMHVSFFPVGVATVALVTAFHFVRLPGGMRPRPLLILLPVALAMGISSMVSLRVWGDVSGPKYAPPYLLAHTLVDGAGKEYLQRVCAQESYALCDYRDSIPDDVEDFMFRTFSPLFAPGRSNRIRAESMSVVVGSAKMFPLQTFEAALRSGITQVLTFNTEVAQLEEISDELGGSLGDSVQDQYPFIGREYRGTKQQLGLLDAAHMQDLNDTHLVIVALSAIVSLLLLVKGVKERDWIVVELLSLVITAILVNGFVSGVAVGVFGRFGARIIWLLPFAAAIAALRHWQTVRTSHHLVHVQRIPPLDQAGH